jgi:L-threonylcarbamoyladenylate synthase
MLLKHYSPNAEMLLFKGPREQVLERMRHVINEREEAGQRVGVLAAGEEAALFEGTGAVVVSLGSRENLEEISARLFAGMRELEHAGVSVMLVRGFEEQGLGVAIWDRLLRATEGRVIEVGGSV